MSHPLQEIIEKLKVRLEKRQATVSAAYLKHAFNRAEFKREFSEIPNDNIVFLKWNRVAHDLNITLGEGPSFLTDTPAEVLQNYAETNAYYVVAIGTAHHRDISSNPPVTDSALNVDKFGSDFLDYFTGTTQIPHLNTHRKIVSTPFPLKLNVTDNKTVRYNLQPEEAKEPLHEVLNIMASDGTVNAFDFGATVSKELFELMNKVLIDPNKGVRIHCQHGKNRTGAVWIAWKQAFGILYSEWAYYHFPEMKHPDYQLDDKVVTLKRALADVRKFDRNSAIEVQGREFLLRGNRFTNHIIATTIEQHQGKLENYSKQIVALSQKQLADFLEQNNAKSIQEQITSLINLVTTLFNTTDKTVDPLVWKALKSDIAKTVECAFEEKNNKIPNILPMLRQLVQITELFSHQMTVDPNEMILVDSTGTRFLNKISHELLVVDFNIRRQRIKDLLPLTMKVAKSQNQHSLGQSDDKSYQDDKKILLNKLMEQMGQSRHMLTSVWNRFSRIKNLKALSIILKIESKLFEDYMSYYNLLDLPSSGFETPGKENISHIGRNLVANLTQLCQLQSPNTNITEILSFQLNQLYGEVYLAIKEQNHLILSIKLGCVRAVLDNMSSHENFRSYISDFDNITGDLDRLIAVSLDSTQLRSIAPSFETKTEATIEEKNQFFNETLMGIFKLENIMVLIGCIRTQCKGEDGLRVNAATQILIQSIQLIESNLIKLKQIVEACMKDYTFVNKSYEIKTYIKTNWPGASTSNLHLINIVDRLLEDVQMLRKEVNFSTNPQSASPTSPRTVEFAAKLLSDLLADSPRRKSPDLKTLPSEVTPTPPQISTISFT